MPASSDRLRGEACLGYEPDNEAPRCYPVYSKDDNEHTVIAPAPPEGHTELPEVATIEYYGRDYEADLCFKRKNGNVVPGYCWTPNES